MTSTDCAYAAGFFDGEGWVGIAYPKINKSEKRNHRLDVSVGQVDIRPLVWLVEKFGGRIQKNPKKCGLSQRLIYSWRINGPSAEAFLVAVRPYLIVKAEQADVALAFRKTIKRQQKGHVTPALIEHRDELRSKLSLLKRVV